MKIGIVCYPTFGGSGVVATELGMCLAAKGHEVHFISYSQPFRLDFFSSNLFYHEVTVGNYPLFDYAPYEISLSSKLVDVVLHHQLDLLHVHYAIPHASAAYLAKQILKEKGIHIPFVTTLHGTDISLLGRDASFKPVITFAINQSDAVTAVSEFLKAETYRYFDVRVPVEVIPNFIDVRNYGRPDDKCFKGMYARNGEKVLTHISNFRAVKRVEDVIRVFHKVKQALPAKLILAGDGPDRANAEKLSRELGIFEDVVFLGKIKAIEKVLCMSDLFLLTSESESFGLSALEALATGVPVISSNTGGIPEVNVHGYCGFLSPVGHVDEMAAHAIRLLQNDAEYALFSQQAKARALHFDVEKVLPLYEAVYDKMVRASANSLIG